MATGSFAFLSWRPATIVLNRHGAWPGSPNAQGPTAILERSAGIFAWRQGKPHALAICRFGWQTIPRMKVYVQSWKGVSKSIYWDHNPINPRFPAPRFPVRPMPMESGNGNRRRTGTVKFHAVLEWLRTPRLRGRRRRPKSRHRSEVIASHHRLGDGMRRRANQSLTSPMVPINVFRKDWPSAERGHAIECKNGRIDYTATARTIIRYEFALRRRVYRIQDGPRVSSLEIVRASNKTSAFRQLRP